MFQRLCLCGVSCVLHLFANIGPQGFYPFNYNRCFVETGTFGGDGVKKALAAGFAEIFSIEIDRGIYQRAVKQFSKQKRIHLFWGDSGKDLWRMIEPIREPITFWLDGHIYPPRTDGGPNCPLMQELDQIRRHPVKTHTILIDDMHCCGTVLFDFLTKEDLIRKILEINPAYTIRYIPGGDEGEYPENVMVAELKPKNL